MHKDTNVSDALPSKAEKRANWETVSNIAQKMVDQCWPEGVEGPINPWLNEDIVKEKLYGSCCDDYVPSFAKELEIDGKTVKQAISIVASQAANMPLAKARTAELLEVLQQKSENETVDLETLCEGIAQQKAKNIVEYYQKHSFMTDTEGPFRKIFAKCREVIKEKLLNSSQGLDLYHGCDRAVADDIVKNGFDLAYQETGLEIGGGVYMGSDSTARKYALKARGGPVLRAQVFGPIKCGLLNQENYDILTRNFFNSAMSGSGVQQTCPQGKQGLLGNEFRRLFFQRLGYDVLIYNSRWNDFAQHTVVLNPEILQKIEKGL